MTSVARSRVEVVVIWAVTGPLFNYSDTWQLVINTGTTIVTFLLVFLIQHTQNRDTLALQLKLDELILATKQARNEVVAIEEGPEEVLEAAKEELRKKAPPRHRRSQPSTDTMKPRWGQFFMTQRGQFRMAFDIVVSFLAGTALDLPPSPQQRSSFMASPGCPPSQATRHSLFQHRSNRDHASRSPVRFRSSWKMLMKLR
jgi:low affinity Fe/Cu permease